MDVAGAVVATESETVLFKKEIDGLLAEETAGEKTGQAFNNKRRKESKI